jgi:hypothetical protein
MKKGLNKKAQFFLLAAVIISAIIISLGMTANEARILKEPKSISDYSYNVKRETTALIDYDIYTNFQTNANLDNFVELLSNDMRDKDPSLDFLIIYGNSTQINIKNYGSTTASFGETTIAGGGRKINSTVMTSLGGTEVFSSASSYPNDQEWSQAIETGINENSYVNVTIGNEFSYPFSISKYRQVILIIKKDKGDESYVSIK